MTPALGRQKQVDLYEFEASLISRAEATQQDFASKTKTKSESRDKNETNTRKKCLLFPTHAALVSKSQHGVSKEHSIC